MDFSWSRHPSPLWNHKILNHIYRKPLPLLRLFNGTHISFVYFNIIIRNNSILQVVISLKFFLTKCFHFPLRATCSCLIIFLYLIALMLIHATILSKILITQFLSIRPFPTVPSSDATHEQKFVNYWDTIYSLFPTWYTALLFMYNICYPLSSTCFRPHRPIIRRSKLYMQPMVFSPSADVYVVQPLRKNCRLCGFFFCEKNPHKRQFFLNGRTTKTSAEVSKETN